VPNSATDSRSPKPIVASVRDLGLQFLNNDVHIAGHDGASSVLLPDGRSLWLFGDSILGQRREGDTLDFVSMLTGSAAVVPQQDVSQGIRSFDYLKNPNGVAREPVAHVEGEEPILQRLWAVHGVCVGCDVFVFYHIIHLSWREGAYQSFSAEGMGIARGRFDNLRFERLTAPDGSMLFWKPGQPTFGVFALCEGPANSARCPDPSGDEYVYLFGAYFDPKLDANRVSICLARTHPGAIADLPSYEYLVQAPSLDDPTMPVRWDRTFRPSALLFDGVPNEMSGSYNPYLGRYVAFHMMGVDNQCAVRTAPELAGPWSEAEIFCRPERLKDDQTFYALKEHPELARDGGRVVYVTYVSSPDYMPRLLELTLA